MGGRATHPPPTSFLSRTFPDDFYFHHPPPHLPHSPSSPLTHSYCPRTFPLPLFLTHASISYPPSPSSSPDSPPLKRAATNPFPFPWKFRRKKTLPRQARDLPLPRLLVPVDVISSFLNLFLPPPPTPLPLSPLSCNVLDSQLIFTFSMALANIMKEDSQCWRGGSGFYFSGVRGNSPFFPLSSDDTWHTASIEVYP